MSDEMFKSLQKMDDDQIKYGRRKFAVILGVGVAGLIGWKYYDSLPQTYHPRKTSFFTTNEDFYSVSVNMFYKPNLDLEKWRLELVDIDKKSFQLSLGEIKSLPSHIINYTYCCIGNKVGGTDISNAAWKVVLLKDLLKPISTDKREGIRMVAYGLDGYYSSVPLEQVLDQDSYLAYEMNGVALPKEHGMPTRVIIPGRYGMKQPKWLKKIEITDRKVTGYWEEQNWSDDAELKSLTRLDYANDIETKGKDILMGGIAFCGKTSVSKVEVSVDNGKTWAIAEFETTPEKNVWTLWKYLWKRPQKGVYTIVCRVVDEHNKKQIETEKDWFPSGSTGLHKVKLNIV
jgi:DMSO/TMAO reductase YedYZ molybdopterin-dependent catalytic subunit